MHYNLGKQKYIAIHFAIKFQSLQQYTYNLSDTFKSLCSNLNLEYFSVDLIFFKCQDVSVSMNEMLHK